VSGDNRYRAYVEVEAVAFAPERAEGYEGPLCANTSKVFATTQEEKAFRLVYMQSPKRFELGNSIRVVDWSPDGTHLLLERTVWQYESEGHSTDFLLFSPHLGVVTKTDLYALLTDRFGKECGYEISIAGFTNEGTVVVEVKALSEGWEEMYGKTCVSENTLLSLDVEHGMKDSIKALPDGFKVRRYGKFVGEPPK
jgi:hypothetical protein